MIIGDVNTVRLAHAKAQGFEIADLSHEPSPPPPDAPLRWTCQRPMNI
ncbi:hypothetical protein [Pseudomonas sp. PD9R]|nr:hypothetical protein [Pseudomonas sp. PD9R]